MRSRLHFGTVESDWMEPGYRAGCACGWREEEPYESRSDAAAAAQDHVAAAHVTEAATAP